MDSKFEKGVLAAVFGFMVTLPFSGPLLLDAVAMVPTSTNVEHLNNEAEQAWSERGYDYIRTIDENPSGAGLFSGYDLRVGGGIITCELQDQETGETKYGKMQYDTAGFLNTHVLNNSPTELTNQMSATTSPAPRSLQP